MKLVIKNRNLVTLCNFLNSLPLTGTESRERVKFVQSCTPHVEQLEARRLKMAEEFADKDPDGKPVMVEDANGAMTFDISEENTASFKKSFDEILDAEFEMSVEDGNLTKLRTVKLLVLGTDQKFSGSMAAEHAAWCEAFEKLEF